MKKLSLPSMRWILSVITITISLQMGLAQTSGSASDTVLTKISGWVFDKATGEAIPHATIKWSGTNVIVISNEEGKFSIKANLVSDTTTLEIHSLGYQKRNIAIRELNKPENKIILSPAPISLSQISVFPTDPNVLIRAVLSNKLDNYMSDNVIATAFYRETIKKGWSYASLSEAVLSINKQPYSSSRADQIQLLQGRKSTDYNKIDTISFNLEGGPFSALRMDILKEPYLLFDEAELGKYDFKMSTVLPNDKEVSYVIDFIQKPTVDEPLFFGKLYIDPKKMVLTKAVFSMNLKNKAEATQIFIKQKPAGAKVTPTVASYTVSYSEQNGKWAYAYSKGEVTFKVNWKRKIFNSTYITTIEMAITNWKPTEIKNFPATSRMKSSVRMNQAVEGFKNPDFWGNYNIIEPEIPIEKAIEKIKKNLQDK